MVSVFSRVLPVRSCDAKWFIVACLSDLWFYFVPLSNNGTLCLHAIQFGFNSVNDWKTLNRLIINTDQLLIQFIVWYGGDPCFVLLYMNGQLWFVTPI